MNASALQIVAFLAAAAVTVPVLGQQSQPSFGQGTAPPPGTLRESSGPPTPGALYIVEQPTDATGPRVRPSCTDD